jgi:TatD DNase family protein
MNKFIDTHAHLDDKKFDEDRDIVIQKCVDAGTKFIIDPAVNIVSCKKIKMLTDKYDIIYAAYGIHPHDAKDAQDNDPAIIESMFSDKKAVAVGEIGLDYHYDFSPREIQIKVFRDFLKLAKKIKKPVIIHNRESDEDMMEILESESSPDLTGQLHCFSGDTKLAKILLDMGFYISFTGSITFSKNQYSEVVEMIPLDRLLLETDSPYMSPVPFRGRRCDSTMIPAIVEKISEIKRTDKEIIFNETYKNSLKLFGLPNKHEDL